jgi:hypothetical protein
LRPNEDGLSSFDATVVTAREALQAFIEDNTARAHNEDDTAMANARNRLEEYPDVETMVEKGWRIIAVPVSELRTRGFQLTDTEPNGHLEIEDGSLSVSWNLWNSLRVGLSAY